MKTVALAFVALISFLPGNATAGVIDFTDIVLWAGSGTNEAALVVDWKDGRSPLAWGYRWDGAATGEDLLLAIVAADSNFYTSLNNTFGPGLFASGFGYDRDADSFAVTGGSSATPFDANGIYIGSPSNDATSVDADDSYAETNTAPASTGFGDFWEYSVGTGNPYAGGSWGSSNFGMSGRNLSNGDWDGWHHPGFAGGEPAMALAAGAAVPEPGGLLVLFSLALALISCRRPKRQIATV